MLKLLAHNWNLKLTALILAVGLWSHVRGEVNPWETATFRVPLDWRPPAKTVLLNRDKIPTSVKVTLRATRSRLRELKGFAPVNPLATADAPPLGVDADGQKPVRAWLDWSLARRGRQDVPIKAETRNDDLEVIGIKPGDVVVQLDLAAQKAFPVQAQLETARGYSIQSPRLQIDSVTAYAPSNALQRVAGVRARVRSGRLRLNAAQRIAAPLEAVDEKGAVVEEVRLEPESAPVVATLRERIVTRRIAVEATLRGLPDGTKPNELQVSPARLSVRGPLLQIESIESLRVVLDVSRGDLEADSFQRRVRVSPPRGMRLMASDQVTVKVLWRRNSSASDVAASKSTPTAAPSVVAPSVVAPSATATQIPLDDELPVRAENNFDTPPTAR